MKLTVEFPSVAYREGPDGVAKLARAIESIGFDQLDIFDHVVMGYPLEDRAPGLYPAKMPILEALMTLSYAAAVTKTIGLGTEVLVLPQRQPVLVAKQIATLELLSGNRVRLGVGVGWQDSEFEALSEDFRSRGRRMDKAIDLLRQCWRDETIERDDGDYRLEAIAMEPKPERGDAIPIWIGGASAAALKRVGQRGNGWLATGVRSADDAQRSFDTIRQHALDAGRDPETLEFQSMVAPPPRENDQGGRDFFKDHDKVAKQLEAIRDMGFGWAAINATAIFQAGARSVDAMIDALGTLHDRLRQV